MRFLCDEMLQAVGRWLRAAGHDVRQAEAGSADATLVVLAREENRRLLTCDKRLAERAPADCRVMLLASEAPDPAAIELRERLGVDWLEAPFSRCLLDNAPLRSATPIEAARLPEATRRRPGPVMVCDRCGRLYWPGSHVRRMRARLAAWAGVADP